MEKSSNTINALGLYMSVYCAVSVMGIKGMLIFFLLTWPENPGAATISGLSAVTVSVWAVAGRRTQVQIEKTITNVLPIQIIRKVSATNLIQDPQPRTSKKWVLEQ